MAASFPDLQNKESLEKEVEKALAWDGGHLRGLAFASDFLRAVEAYTGEDAQEKIQEKLNELGVDIDLSDISSHAWYPAGYGAALYLVSSYLYDWSSGDIEEVGRLATRGSMRMKIIMHLVSMETTLKYSRKLWRKYYDFGELVPLEINQDEDRIRFKITDYTVHPISEFYHKGYFRGIVELVTGSDSVQVEVPVSAFDGREHSEFVISW